MPADRFYINEPLSKGISVSLIEAEHHHLSHVMRVSVGEEVELVNGHGALATAKISSIDRQSTKLHILAVQTTPCSSQQIILAIPLVRPNKLELILEKGTELGADGFWLYAADFSEKTTLSANQLERLRHLTVSALKQSGRLFLPELQILPSLDAIHGFLLFGDTRPEAQKITEIELQKTTIFITGPEKGFSPRELSLLEKKAKGVRLSSNILRAETAPLAAVSILALQLEI